MTIATRLRQARCAALGFWPGPIDGKWGKRSEEAYQAALASQRRKGLPFVHSSGVQRVHLHWTAGHHKANSTDLRAYHGLYEGDGKCIKAADPWVQRSHTLNANSGAVGLSMCCMAGANERPFRWGRAPMTAAQLSAMCRDAASLCIAYDIPVTRWSVLTHAEVQPTFGIVQRWKWDIAVITGMIAPGDPIEVGDKIRDMIRREVAAAK
jgi:hypothetical protein